MSNRGGYGALSRTLSSLSFENSFQHLHECTSKLCGAQATVGGVAESHHLMASIERSMDRLLRISHKRKSDDAARVEIKKKFAEKFVYCDRAEQFTPQAIQVIFDISDDLNLDEEDSAELFIVQRNLLYEEGASSLEVKDLISRAREHFFVCRDYQLSAIQLLLQASVNPELPREVCRFARSVATPLLPRIIEVFRTLICSTCNSRDAVTAVCHECRYQTTHMNEYLLDEYQKLAQCLLLICSKYAVITTSDPCRVILDAKNQPHVSRAGQYDADYEQKVTRLFDGSDLAHLFDAARITSNFACGFHKKKIDALNKKRGLESGDEPTPYDVDRVRDEFPRQFGLAVAVSLAAAQAVSFWHLELIHPISGDEIQGLNPLSSCGPFLHFMHDQVVDPAGSPGQRPAGHEWTDERFLGIVSLAWSVSLRHAAEDAHIREFTLPELFKTFMRREHLRIIREMPKHQLSDEIRTATDAQLLDLIAHGDPAVPPISAFDIRNSDEASPYLRIAHLCAFSDFSPFVFWRQRVLERPGLFQVLIPDEGFRRSLLQSLSSLALHLANDMFFDTEELPSILDDIMNAPVLGQVPASLNFFRFLEQRADAAQQADAAPVASGMGVGYGYGSAMPASLEEEMDTAEKPIDYFQQLCSFLACVFEAYPDASYNACSLLSELPVSLSTLRSREHPNAPLSLPSASDHIAPGSPGPMSHERNPQSFLNFCRDVLRRLVPECADYGTLGELRASSLMVPFLDFLNALSAGRSDSCADTVFNLLANDMAAFAPICWASFFAVLRDAQHDFHEKFVAALNQQQASQSSAIAGGNVAGSAASASVTSSSSSSQPAALFLQSTSSVLDPDDELIAENVLRVAETVALRSESARSFLLRTGEYSLLDTLFGLMACPSQPSFMGRVLSLLAALALQPVECAKIQKELETAQILDTITPEASSAMIKAAARQGIAVPLHLPPFSQNGQRGGVRNQLLNVEQIHGTYPETLGFLKLLRRIVSFGVPEHMGQEFRPPGFEPYIRFVNEIVFSRYENRDYNRPEKLMVAARSLDVIACVLVQYEPKAADFSRGLVDCHGTSLPSLQPAGFYLMRELLQHNSALLQRILSIISWGVDELHRRRMKTEEGHAAECCVLLALKIIDAALEKESTFMACRSASVSSASSSSGPSSSGTPSLSADLLSLTPLAQNPGIAASAVNIFKYLRYPHNPRVVFHSARIINHLCLNEHVWLVHKLESALDYDIDFKMPDRDAIVHIVRGLITDAQTDGSQGTQWSASSHLAPYDAMEDVIDSYRGGSVLSLSDQDQAADLEVRRRARDAILDILLRGTNLQVSEPNMTGFLCGYYDGSLKRAVLSGCLETLESQSIDAETGQGVEDFSLLNPHFSRRLYDLIYGLARLPRLYTDEQSRLVPYYQTTLQFLDGFFVKHPNFIQERLSRLDTFADRIYRSAFVTDTLAIRANIMKTIALQMYTSSAHEQPHLRADLNPLLKYLFGGVAFDGHKSSMSTRRSFMAASSLAMQGMQSLGLQDEDSAEQVGMRIYELLDCMDLNERPDPEIILSIPGLEEKDFSLASFLYREEPSNCNGRFCLKYDLAAAIRALQSLKSQRKCEISAEMFKQVGSRISLFNSRSEASLNALEFFDGWRQTVLIALGRCDDQIARFGADERMGGAHRVAFELLQALLRRLSKEEGIDAAMQEMMIDTVAGLLGILRQHALVLVADALRKKSAPEQPEAGVNAASASSSSSAAEAATLTPAPSIAFQRKATAPQRLSVPECIKLGHGIVQCLLLPKLSARARSTLCLCLVHHFRYTHRPLLLSSSAPSADAAFSDQIQRELQDANETLVASYGGRLLEQLRPEMLSALDELSTHVPRPGSSASAPMDLQLDSSSTSMSNTTTFSSSAAFALLDTMLIFDPHNKLLTLMASQGLIHSVLEMLSAMNLRLLQAVKPGCSNSDARLSLTVFESLMSFLSRIALSQAGAQCLFLDRTSVVHRLAGLAFIAEYPDYIPPAAAAVSSSSSFSSSRAGTAPASVSKPPPEVERYHQLLIPSLQLIATLLVTLPGNVAVFEGAARFLASHFQIIHLILRDRARLSTTKQESRLLTSIFAVLSSRPTVLDQVLPRAFGYREELMELLSTFCSKEAWMQ